MTGIIEKGNADVVAKVIASITDELLGQVIKEADSKQVADIIADALEASKNDIVK